MRLPITLLLAASVAAPAFVPPVAVAARKVHKERVYHPRHHQQSEAKTNEVIYDLSVPWPFRRHRPTHATAAMARPDIPATSADAGQELLATGTFSMSNILFDTAKADLKPAARRILDEIGRLLAQEPELTVEVGGHADERGTDAFNQRLSEQRAQAVKRYLVAAFPAIDAEHLRIAGYGESRPLAHNGKASAWAKDRRVEFRILNEKRLRRDIQHGRRK